MRYDENVFIRLYPIDAVNIGTISSWISESFVEGCLEYEITKFAQPPEIHGIYIYRFYQIKKTWAGARTESCTKYPRLFGFICILSSRMEELASRNDKIMLKIISIIMIISSRDVHVFLL